MDGLTPPAGPAPADLPIRDAQIVAMDGGCRPIDNFRSMTIGEDAIVADVERTAPALLVRAGKNHSQQVAGAVSDPAFSIPDRDPTP